LLRFRERGPASLLRAVRLSVAAVASYAIALGVVSDARPVTASLTALLIVQVTLVGTVADTFRRILSVIVGVGVAITVSNFAGFTWWSLAALVLGSILLGQALRLGPHLLEVPISAMLILAAGGAGARATDRIIETLIGAFVGLALNVVVPPSIRSRSAGQAVETFGGRIADLLSRVGDRLADGPASRDEGFGWLREQREIAGSIADVDHVLEETRERRRLNPRAAGSWDPVPDLRSGLDALEHCAVALRSVLRSIADGAGAATVATEDDDVEQDGRDVELRRSIAVVLSDLARCIARYATVVRIGAETDATHTELREAVDELRIVRTDLGRSRDHLADLLLVDPRETTAQWKVHGSLLTGIDRVIEELDLDAFASGRERRRQEAAATRRPSTQAAQRIRSSARRVATEYPIVRRRRLGPR
jgi:uncharacterized membrane protein YccC